MSDIPLIHRDHPVWKPVALSDRECVPYLNKLFRAGWSLVPFDMDGIDWMFLTVPLKTPTDVGRRPNPVLMIKEQSEPSVHVVVLRRDGLKDQYRAVLKERNAAGYFDRTSASGLDPKVWTTVIWVALDDQSACEIFSRSRRAK